MGYLRVQVGLKCGEIDSHGISTRRAGTVIGRGKYEVGISLVNLGQAGGICGVQCRRRRGKRSSS